MPDFIEIRDYLQNARNEVQVLNTEVLQAKEKLKKIQNVIAETQRYGGDASSYKLLHEEAQSSLNKLEKYFFEKKQFKDQINFEFEGFTDPRKSISLLSDRYPIFLFPVRLETKFKKISKGGDISHQLWVRIFPDDCSVDTFEETLAEPEIKDSKRYWIAQWETGKLIESGNQFLDEFVRKQHKAAWRSFADDLGTGRSFWIKDQYKPLNIDDHPIRKTVNDMILVIPTEILPEKEEQEALKTYWRDLWLGEVSVEEGLKKLSRTLGESNLKKLLSRIQRLFRITKSDKKELNVQTLLNQYRPVNFDEKKPSEETKNVQVVFLHFPSWQEVNSHRKTWSKAARVNTFPDRFVILGYKGKEGNNPKLVLEKIGNVIPDPLIMGPDPSLDIDKILKEVLIEDFNNLTSGESKQEKLGEYYDNFKDEIKANKNKNRFITDFNALPEESTKNELKQVFNNLKDNLKAEKYVEYLSSQSKTSWLYNFKEAVRVGMGFELELSEEEYQEGFDRLFVIGIKLSADRNEGKNILENWVKHHHFGSSGFSIVPQGTPTNNTAESRSGYSDNENLDKAFERYFSSGTIDDPLTADVKRDGRWLAEFLGISPELSSLKLVDNYYSTDQREVRAMKNCLWGPTLGFFLETLMHPIFKNDDVLVIKKFFSEYISGRGAIPAIRINNQPYGILPTSPIFNLKWIENSKLTSDDDEHESPEIFENLYNLLIQIKRDWNELLEEFTYLGKDNDIDKYQSLLEIIGLHATSIDYDQRYAETVTDLINRIKFQSDYEPSISAFRTSFIDPAKNFLEKFGYHHDSSEGQSSPKFFDLFFLLEKHKIFEQLIRGRKITEDIYGHLIDDRPFSEIYPIRAYSNDGKNYLEWLAEKSGNFNKLLSQEGIVENDIPQALLYRLIRHGLLIDYHNLALNLYLEADIIDEFQAGLARLDADFLGIRNEADGLEFKLLLLNGKDNRIVDSNISVGEHISNLLKEENPRVSQLSKIINNLNHLKTIPTARLERLLAEHLDCCSYRLDAWLSGFINFQLHTMRYEARTGRTNESRQGIYLGAYGWVEDLKPKERDLTKAEIKDQKLREIFDPENDHDIFIDGRNAGYILAPSINQAKSAAILRNAYISNASEEYPDQYKINLSSERVRVALSFIEGLQKGQKMGALLGYQLERRLHDRYRFAEMDKYIFELRRVFPLYGNRHEETSLSEPELGTQTQIEARHVIDGIALLEQVNSTKITSYPFGKEGLEPISDSIIQNIIDEEVDRIRDINDAVADLAVAESVHQIVQGNYDRANGALDAHQKGFYPQKPEFIRTLRSSLTLTSRVGIHLTSGLGTPSIAENNPRVIGEPAINKWLVEILPNLNEVFCAYSLESISYDSETPTKLEENQISIGELGLAPIDLIYTLNIENERSLSAFDELILQKVFEDSSSIDFTKKLRIKYSEAIDGKTTFFELAPLINQLRSLILTSRPLRATDMALQNEARATDNTPQTEVNFDRLEKSLSKFQDIDFMSSNIQPLGELISGDPNETYQNFEAILEIIDPCLENYQITLKKAKNFGIQSAEFEFLFSKKQEIFISIKTKVYDYITRWMAKAETFERLVNEEYPDLDDLEERYEILQKAERTISTTYSSIQVLNESSLRDYMVDVLRKKTNFDERFQELQDFLGNEHHTFNPLFSDINGLIQGEDSGLELKLFDLVEVNLEEDIKKLISLSEDVFIEAEAFNVIINDKKSKVSQNIEEYSSTSNTSERFQIVEKSMKILFGEDFIILPEFSFDENQDAELHLAFSNKESLLQFQLNQTDFPIDDWLYGIARVREKMKSWEKAILLVEALNNGMTLELTPLQLPFLENDNWLGLSYPSTHNIDTDTLLYTAYLREFEIGRTHCGLLLDEWTEEIPKKKETTGISFQHDQPNSEAPQSFLLVTPSDFTNEWVWKDIPDTLHATLDLAKLRTIEPEHIHNHQYYGHFLPATVSNGTYHPLSISLNFMFGSEYSLIKKQP